MEDGILGLQVQQYYLLLEAGDESLALAVDGEILIPQVEVEILDDA